MEKIGKYIVFISTSLILSLILSLFFVKSATFYYNEGIVLSVISLAGYMFGFSFMVIKSDNQSKETAKRLAGYIGFSMVIIALVFKYYHFPFGSMLIIISFLILTLVFSPLYFRNKYNKWKQCTRSAKDAFFLTLFDFLGIAIVLFGIMFKLQHWPAASALAIGGAILVAISVFAWNQKFKKEIVFRKKAEDKLNETLKEVIQKNDERGVK